MTVRQVSVVKKRPAERGVSGVVDLSDMVSWYDNAMAELGVSLTPPASYHVPLTRPGKESTEPAFPDTLGRQT
jgi:hypothetical protein